MTSSAEIRRERLTAVALERSVGLHLSQEFLEILFALAGAASHVPHQVARAFYEPHGFLQLVRDGLDVLAIQPASRRALP